MRFPKADLLIRGGYWAQSNLGFSSVPFAAIILISGSIALRILQIQPWRFFLFAGLMAFTVLFFAMCLFLIVSNDSALRLKLMGKIPRIKSKWILKERNAEVRKLIIEKIGWTKILSDLDARLINQWNSYELYRIQPQDRLIRESFQLLKMKCASSDSDYVLCVPPQIETAEEAIKWVNRGITPEEFTQQT